MKFVPETLHGALFGLLVLGLSGCSLFEGNYTTTPSHRQGALPTYIVGQVTNNNSGGCKDGQVNCEVTGKLILTNSTDNLSFQFFRKDSAGKVQVITCASPAEVEKTLTTSSAAGLSIPVKAAGAAAALAASGSQSSAEAAVLLQSTDTATHFVAISSFVNCLAFASEMYGADAAARLQARIFVQGAAIASAASSPSK